MELELEVEIIRRIRRLYEHYGIDKHVWMELTGFSEHQWYRWTSDTSRSHPSSPQAVRIFRTTDISPSYAWFELGPKRLSEFQGGTQPDGLTMEEKIDRIYRAIVGYHDPPGR